MERASYVGKQGIQPRIAQLQERDLQGHATHVGKQGTGQASVQKGKEKGLMNWEVDPRENAKATLRSKEKTFRQSDLEEECGQ